MSAVRMVAYGVLEMKHKNADAPWFLEGDVDLTQTLKDNFDRDQLRKLVNDELTRYGLQLRRVVVPNGARYRTKNNEHHLFGQVQKGRAGSFVARPVLHTGTFKECCEVAARMLDELDAAQVEDKITGPAATGSE